MQLKREQSDFKKDGHSKSEFKLPRLLNNHSTDYLSNRNTNAIEDNSRFPQTSNNSMINGSMVNSISTKSRRARYFLDSSIISEHMGQDIASKMEYINIHEQKKIMQPELETEFDLNNFLLNKNDKDNRNLPQHYMLQDDLKTYFNVEKNPVYAKISTAGKNFPMKVKVTATEGTYDFHFSFFDPFPDKEKSSEEFPQRKEHLYKFLKPKTFSQWAYICLTSKNSAKIELKVWFTNQNLEKFRSKDKSQTNKNSSNASLPLKERLKQELSEQEKKALYIEVMQIKQKKFQKLKMQDQQIIERNKELAANYHLLQKKKEFDHIIHSQRCEEVVRKSISLQLLDYQQKYQKYFTKVINHRITLEKVARKKFQTQVNYLACNWLPIFYLVNLCDKLQEKVYVSKLASIFKGRKVRAFEELVRTFKGKKLEIKPFMNDKQRLMSDVLLSMNVKAKQIKRIKKKMAAQVLIYFVHNQKQNHVLNTIVSLSKRTLYQVTLIQRKRRATINLHQFISLKMMDGLCETLKDEDFRRKQTATTPQASPELSFYISYLKKKDKQILVKSFLKIIKEQFRHQLSLSLGKIPPLTQEDLNFMELETKNMKRDVSEFLDIRTVNRKEIVYEAVEILDEAEQEEKEQKRQLSLANKSKSKESVGSDTEEKVPIKKSKYQLNNNDWNLLEIIRNTQVKIKIIQGRQILRELLVQRLTEIKAERDEGLNQIYLTQQESAVK